MNPFDTINTKSNDDLTPSHLTQVKWGILGAGHIAAEFADGVKGSESGVLVAIASRSQSSANDFGAQHGIERCYGNYQDLLNDSDVDAVYIATPHPMHAQWAIKAAEAGKHMLVEKPLGMNWPEAMAMIDAARVNDVFLMEAFMYRCHPQTARLVSLIREGSIGEVRLIRASFCYCCDQGLEHRAFAQELGGGGILDVGCYPVSMARLIAGAVQGTSFAEPLDVKAHAHLGATGVDEWASATLKFTGGLLAQLTTGVRLVDKNWVEIVGTEGRILVEDPWVPSRWNREPLKIKLEHYDKRGASEVLVEADKDLYSYEIDVVGRDIERRQAQAPAMSWDDTLGNMRVLDRWRQEVGLIYEMEKPQNVLQTVSRRPLEVRPNIMRYGRIPGLEKPVSRLVIGSDTAYTMPDTAILFDGFFELGGNAFDTSRVYGHDGNCEANLGQWIRNRGIREQVVVLEKGGNYPNNTPEGLSRDVQISLEKTGLDYFDIYMIHRDNPEIPIDEWVDALNENWCKGYFRTFGVSNFTQERLEAGLEYALSKGLQGFSAVSNNFSLARMLDPVWELCVSSSDLQFRNWFESTQMPLMPWSSQARGFFTPRAKRGDTSSEEFNRCWYSEDNFQRKERAEFLAREKNVQPINIALAYALCQPFPTFPLVGPKQLSEIRSSLQALDITLTLKEIEWLDLRSESLEK